MNEGVSWGKGKGDGVVRKEKPEIGKRDANFAGTKTEWGSPVPGHDCAQTDPSGVRGESIGQAHSGRCTVTG